MKLHIRRLFSAGLVVAAVGCGDDSPPAFEASRVIRHVEAQCAHGARLPNTAARDSAAAYLARSLEACGARVRVQVFDVPDPYGDRVLRLMNIIASFAPERGRRVLLASHYDSRPWADQEPDTALHTTPVPGAVDGACSAGVLLEIGRLLGERMPATIGVDLVMFDGEDYGKEGDLEYYLLGSTHFADNMEGYRPECAILLDMVGGVGTRIAKEAHSAEYAPALTDTLFSRAAHLGLDYFVAERGTPIVDDHIPLLRRRIPATDLFGYDYPYWHTVSDTPDKCVPELIAQVGALLVDFLYRYPYL